MIAQITFNASPDDLRAMLEDVMAPMVNRLNQLEAAQSGAKIYTVAELADYISYSPQMVRRFITGGKQNPKGKTIYLKAFEITKGDYRVAHSDLEEFLSHF